MKYCIIHYYYQYIHDLLVQLKYTNKNLLFFISFILYDSAVIFNLLIFDFLLQQVPHHILILFTILQTLILFLI
jgi:hypothetical protein